jgi:6-phosphogluconate dehydrogenase
VQTLKYILTNNRLERKVKIGFVGLGKMGANMVRRLLRDGHAVVGYNRSQAIVRELTDSEGMIPATTVESMLEKLEAPKVVWVMLPAGSVTEDMFQSLLGKLEAGDIIIDGANSNFKDSMRRGLEAKEHKIGFVDAGVSGGIWGLKEGYSIMVGGEKVVVDKVSPLFRTLAPGKELGWGHVGPSGSGHFVKMVHNGIEYGMMEAYAEGYEILKARKEYALDLHQITKIWQHGSVVRSWLLDLAESALAVDAELSDVKGWVADSGEGRWTVMEAIDQSVPAPVITMSLFRRFESRQDESFGAKMLAALRNQFGGHEIKRPD